MNEEKNSRFDRSKILIGESNIEKLKASRVAIFGIGGVGGYVCESLVRCGIGAFDIIDSDKVDITNINRQIIALSSTVGKYKVDVMKERMFDINPDVKVVAYKEYFSNDNKDIFPFNEYNYIVDAIDSIEPKIELIRIAKENNIKIVSAMGAGYKLRGEMFKIADIYDTKVCPLAKRIRSELRNIGIKELKVVYSEEEPIKIGFDNPITKNSDIDRQQKQIGSISYAPAIMGLLLSEIVISDLINET